MVTGVSGFFAGGVDDRGVFDGGSRGRDWFGRGWRGCGELGIGPCTFGFLVLAKLFGVGSNVLALLTLAYVGWTGCLLHLDGPWVR